MAAVTTPERPRVGFDLHSESAVIELPQPQGDSPELLAAWFDEIYRTADGDPGRVPWARHGPSPCLVAWLNAVAPSFVRPGGRVCVVGCGLGHDAVELINRGYDVSAFDISPTAIEWARRLHPDHADRFFVADACDPPPRLRCRADLVVEINTLQSVPPKQRVSMAQCMANLLGPHGSLLVICLGRDADEPAPDADTPPHPISPPELTSLMQQAGLQLSGNLDEFDDDETPPKRRLRVAFRRV